MIILIHLENVDGMFGDSWRMDVTHLGTVVCITEKLLANFFLETSRGGGYGWVMCHG